MYMLVYDFGVLEINALKYEDEMQFWKKYVLLKILIILYC